MITAKHQHWETHMIWYGNVQRMMTLTNMVIEFLHLRLLKSKNFTYLVTKYWLFPNLQIC